MIDEFFCFVFVFFSTSQRTERVVVRGGAASGSLEFFSLSGFGLPVCPGDKYHEVHSGLSTSVCVAALRKPATEGRGPPENTTSRLQLAEMAAVLYLNEYVLDSDLIRLHRRTFPVVEVILQISISYTEFELLQEHFIFHEIQGIENIEPFLWKNTHIHTTFMNLDLNESAPELTWREEITSLARMSASFIRSRRGVCV